MNFIAGVTTGLFAATFFLTNCDTRFFGFLNTAVTEADLGPIDLSLN